MPDTSCGSCAPDSPNRAHPPRLLQGLGALPLPGGQGLAGTEAMAAAAAPPPDVLAALSAIARPGIDALPMDTGPQGFAAALAQERR